MSIGEVAGVAKAASLAVKPVTSVVRWLRPDTSPRAISAVADDLAAEVLRRESQLLDQLAGGPDRFIDVGLSLSARQRLTTEEDQGVVDLTDLGNHYLALPAPARMAILGPAGAGKTVAAIHTLLTVLEARARLPEAARARTPVPVRVNAAGWDGTHLAGWLAYRLAVDYRLKPRTCKALVDAGLILPVIDGLDEMDHPAPTTGTDAAVERAVAAVEQLNSPPWSNRPVIVSSRTDTYDLIRRVRGDGGVHRTTVLSMASLSPETVIDYLDEYRTTRDLTASHSWDAVTDTIVDTPDGVLAVALSTPWTLGVTATALHRTPEVADTLIACATVDEVRDCLFATLIPAAIAATDPHTKIVGAYTEPDVHRWLTTLANNFDQVGDNSIRLDQLWRLTGYMGEMSATGKVRAWRVPGRRRWPMALLVGLAFSLPPGFSASLAFGIWLGLKYGSAEGVAGALFFGLAFGLAGWITGALVAGLETTESDQLRRGSNPDRMVREDTAFGLAVGLAVALALGLIFGCAAWLALGPAAGLAIGPAAGLIVGVAAGLSAALSTATFAVTCWWFRKTGVFAPRPVVFFRWAHAAGLLRVTGQAYQFRHETFARWLAEASAADRVDGPGF